MNEYAKMIKEAITKLNLTIVEEDSESIVVRFQMQKVFIYLPTDDFPFVDIMSSALEDVDDSNFSAALEKCNTMNNRLKMVKCFVNEDILVTSTEFYFLGFDDLCSQIEKSLMALVCARVLFRKLGK